MRRRTVMIVMMMMMKVMMMNKPLITLVVSKFIISQVLYLRPHIRLTEHLLHKRNNKMSVIGFYVIIAFKMLIEISFKKFKTAVISK